VDEELRGWNWDKHPLKPRAYLDLGVSEIASKYCETRRDVWLRRKINAKPSPSEPVLKGWLVHAAVSTAIYEASRLFVQGLEPWDVYEVARNKWKSLVSNEVKQYSRLVESMYKQTLLGILGEAVYEQSTKNTRFQPVLVSEFKVDGQNLGLSQNLSIDVLVEGGVIMDFKYGSPRDFHKLSLVGYALALEAEFEVPYDYGLLVYVSEYNERLRVAHKPVYLNSHLRKWFIEERDEIIDMLLENREPPVDPQCSPSCPYYRVCHS
jgi:CRISPR-associated protein, Csa1 family